MINDNLNITMNQNQLSYLDTVYGINQEGGVEDELNAEMEIEEQTFPINITTYDTDEETQNIIREYKVEDEDKQKYGIFISVCFILLLIGIIVFAFRASRKKRLSQ